MRAADATSDLRQHPAGPVGGFPQCVL